MLPRPIEKMKRGEVLGKTLRRASAAQNRQDGSDTRVIDDARLNRVPAVMLAFWVAKISWAIQAPVQVPNGTTRAIAG